jgi:hypothetical protein
MDLTAGVGARLAALSLDRKGRLTSQLLPSDAVRCGVLMDLARRGHLSLMETRIDVNPVPTGFPAADQLLSAIRDEPERTLNSWLGEHRFGLVQVADALVQTGRWNRTTKPLRRSRYEVWDDGQRDRDLRLDISQSDFDWQPPDAAVAALGTMANLLGRYRELTLKLAPPEIPPDVFAAAGGQRWLLQAAVEYLGTARTRYALGASILDVGGSAH